MAADHVEMLRRTADYWNERAWASMETLLTPDVTVVPPDGWPEAETIEGWDAWKRQIERLKDSWEEDRIEVEDIRQLDPGDRFLVTYRWTMRGKDSGIPFETPAWCVYAFREGRIDHIQFFMDESLAREATETPPAQE
jgi:ketosteroid isomerase-like protein